ncbi:tetratricopeptide repeat protein [Singulisphaera rosea]
MTTIVAAVGSALSWLRTESVPPAALLARKAMASGQFTKALPSIDSWLQASPRSAEAHLTKARAMLALDRVDEFTSSFKRAKELGAPESEVELVVALLQVRQSRYRDAWPVLIREYESRKTPDPMLKEAVARIYLEYFELEKAMAVIDRWIADAPGSAKAYFWRVEIDNRVPGESSRLLADYRKAVALDPTLTKARIGLAKELLKLHRNQEAAKEFDAYLALCPDDAEAHVGAGNNASELGDTASSILHFDRAIALSPKNVEALRERAEIDLKQDRFEPALERLGRAIALDPFDLDARYDRVLVLGRLGRQEESKDELDIVKRLRADNEELNKIKEKLVHAPHDVAIQLEVAGWMFAHGHGPEGERWTEKILRATPGQPEACRLVADYHERSGNPGLANFYRLQSKAPSPAPVQTR